MNHFSDETPSIHTTGTSSRVLNEISNVGGLNVPAVIRQSLQTIENIKSPIDEVENVYNSLNDNNFGYRTINNANSNLSEYNNLVYDHSFSNASLINLDENTSNNTFQPYRNLSYESNTSTDHKNESGSGLDDPNLQISKVGTSSLQLPIHSCNKTASIRDINEATQKYEDNYIYQVLMSNPEGVFLLKIYNFEKDPERRAQLIVKKKRTYFSLSKVARIVVFYETHRLNSYSIPPERLEFLANSAYELFGKPYLKESFYSKATSTSNPNGAFYQALITIREQAVAINEIKLNTSAVKRKWNNIDETNLEVFEELKAQVSIIDEDYKKKWANTAFNERQEFYTKSELNDIFATFPSLSHAVGYVLIQQDFRQIYNLPPDIFIKNWPALSLKIYTIACNKKDKSVKAIISDNVALIQNEHKQILALILLPYIFKKINKQTSRSKSKVNWSPDQAIVSQSFVYHLKESYDVRASIVDIQKELEQIHEKYQLRFKHPFVVIYGRNVAEITCAYIVVGSHIYQIQSSLQAVNICFQLTKVLFRDFCLINNHIWQLLEREVYEFKNVKLNANVCKVIEELQRL